MLQHQLHDLDTVNGKALIALGFEVSKIELFLDLISGMIGCLPQFMINHYIPER
jgi:hypothetical protein